MNLKRAPMYSKMVEDMLQMTKIQHEATIEFKWEAFKKVISHAQTNVFRPTTYWKYNNKFSSKKKWFDKECHETRKCLISLDVVKDKENYQKHLHEYKRLIQRESTCMC